MDKLDILAKEYKKTKSQKNLNELLLLLDKQLNDKAKYLFYQQKFKVNGQRIRLKDTGKITPNDLVQELRLTVLELLQKYNPNKPFSNYVFATLWNFVPEIIRKKSGRQDLRTINESELNNDDEEKPINLDDFPAPEQKNDELINLSEKFKKLTKIEKKLIKFILKNPNKNQTQMADSIGVTQQEVSQILIGLRKKYKIFP